VVEFEKNLATLSWRAGTGGPIQTNTRIAERKQNDKSVKISGE